MWGKEMRKWLEEDTTHSLLYGGIFDFHRNGIYATLSEGKNNNNTTYGDLVRPMPSVLMAIDTGGVHLP